MKQVKFKAVALLLCAIIAQCLSEVAAQNMELRWLTGWKNGESTTEADIMSDVVVDDEGNSYVAGTFGYGAVFLDGTDIEQTCPTPIDPSWPRARYGVLLAKYDTAGNIVWIKTAQSSLRTGDGMGFQAGRLVKSGDRLYLSISFYGRHHSGTTANAWMFDTLYTWPFDPITNPNLSTWQHHAIPDSLRRWPFNTHDGGISSAIVVFDLDGNRLENHSIVINHYYSYISGIPYMNWEHHRLNREQHFVVDSDKNIHLFFSDRGYLPSAFANNRPDSTGFSYIIIDDDTNTSGKVLTWPEIFGSEAYDTMPGSAFYVKIDSNWKFVDWKPLLQRLDTELPTLVDTVYVSNRDAYDNWGKVGYIIGGVDIDEEDNIYVQGAMYTIDSFYRRSNNSNNYYRVDYPHRIFLDSTHYIRVDNFTASTGIPIYAKYDSHGNVQWINQLYLQTEDTHYYGTSEITKVGGTGLYPRVLSWDSEYVYCIAALREDLRPLRRIILEGSSEPWLLHNWYCDSNYTHLVPFPDSATVADALRQNWRVRQHAFLAIVVYDRETGEFVKYIKPMEELFSKSGLGRTYPSSARVLLPTDSIMLINVQELSDEGAEYYMLIKYDNGSDSATVYDSTVFRCGGHQQYIHPNGWWISGNSRVQGWVLPRPSPPAEYINQFSQNLTLMMFCYLPEFDQRRPVVVECPPVEGLRVTHVVGDIVTLAWSGGTNHMAWQAAYLPVGEATDSTAWDHARLVETTDTTLPLQLDTCCLLRVRGICGEENRSPWSETVEVCPSLGVGTEHLASGPVLSPNPAREVVDVLDGATGTAERHVREIEVISPLGQTVLRMAGVSRFNVAGLASGTYMVKIRTTSGTTLRKLTVKGE